MKQYIVTRRPGKGLAAEFPSKQFPSYRIAAETAVKAKKIACRIDRQDECFWRLYIATPERLKKHRPAATDRCFATSHNDIASMKTIDILSQIRSKRNREVRNA